MMKHWHIVVIGILLLAGCKTKAKVIQVPVRESVKVTQTLEPVVLPTDSLLLEALFRCDSMNMVRLIEISELKTKRVSSGFKFENNKLTYSAQVKPDTVYMRGTIIERDREVPVYVDVPGPVEYRLRWWQETLMWMGVVLSLGLAVWVFIKAAL